MSNQDLFAGETEWQKPSDPVTCIGMTFDNDEAPAPTFPRNCARNFRNRNSAKSKAFPLAVMRTF